MDLPSSRGKRLAIYLDEQVCTKAVARFKNLDRRIEQFLREEIERDEKSAALPDPAMEKVGTDSAGFENFGDTSGAFLELNPDAQHQPAPRRSEGGKRDRLPVLKPKRRGT